MFMRNRCRICYFFVFWVKINIIGLLDGGWMPLTQKLDRTCPIMEIK